MLTVLAHAFYKTRMVSIKLSLLFCSSTLIGMGFIGPKSSTILTGLEEQEVNEILVLLDSYGMPAEKKEVAPVGNNKFSSWSIIVSKKKRIEALSLLNMHGRPRRRTSSTLLSLFNKQGLVSSEMEEKIRYQAGLADQIANILRKLEGVLDADVQLSIPQEESIPGFSEQKKVTASVYIKHQGILEDPNSHLIMKIKRLVANSIPDLDAENVTVIGDRAVINTDSSSLIPELISIWDILIDSESVSKFRFVFIILLLLVLLEFSIIIFILWKMQAFILSVEGRRQLTSLIPIEVNMNAQENDELQISKPSPYDSRSQKPEQITKSTLENAPTPEAPSKPRQEQKNTNKNQSK